MLRVGLTGSIGVGKSFVSTVLRELGCHVLDADQTAREVVAAGSVGLSAVVEAFGNEILQSDGTLNRAKLRTLVFADETHRTRLNAILHPLIIKAQDAWLREQEARDIHGISVIDAALMIESGGYRRFEKLIVVHCRNDVQLERLVKRDGLTFAEAKRLINVQMSQEEKMSYADFLIDTSEGFDETRRQTEKIYFQLCNLITGR